MGILCLYFGLIFGLWRAGKWFWEQQLSVIFIVFVQFKAIHIFHHSPPISKDLPFLLLLVVALAQSYVLLIFITGYFPLNSYRQEDVRWLIPLSPLWSSGFPQCYYFASLVFHGLIIQFLMYFSLLEFPVCFCFPESVLTHSTRSWLLWILNWVYACRTIGMVPAHRDVHKF